MTSLKTEIRTDGTVHISGYVNAVERDSRILQDKTYGTFVERVGEGVFANALDRADKNIMLKFNHNRIIGQRGQNLALTEDNIGLYAEAQTADIEVVTAAKAGKLRGWSFGFMPLEEDWGKTSNGLKLRRLKKIDLIEVSILTDTPAYPANSIEVRSGCTRSVVPLDTAKAELYVLRKRKK